MKISNSVREEAAKIVSTKTKSQSIFVWSFSSKRREEDKKCREMEKKVRREEKAKKCQETFGLMKGLACHGFSDCLGGQFGTFGDSGQKVEEASVLGLF